jgi:SAM-dependent methyltransferase
MQPHDPSPPVSTTSSDWSTTRGEKWSTNLAGLEAMLRPVDEPLIHTLQLDRPCRIAEMGCGGGGTSLEILRRAPAGSVVHAFDISPRLIEIARTRPRPGAGTLVFDVADMATAKPEAPYDRIVSRFAVMFFEDPPAAFSNLVHWLVPGGRFAFAVWGPVSENPWMTVVRDVVAGFVEVPQPEPNAPGAFRYADSGAFLSLLGEAGFAHVAAREWRGALAVGGGLKASDAARFALSSFSTFGELLAEAGANVFDEAHRSLTTAFSRHEQEGAVRIEACVRVFTGLRP